MLVADVQRYDTHSSSIAAALLGLLSMYLFVVDVLKR